MAGGYTVIGRIVGAHGLAGEVKVAPLTSYPERFVDLERCFVDGAEGRQTFVVEGVRGLGGRYVLVKFQGVDDRTAAEAFRGRDVLVPDEERVKLPEGEYFQADLVGCAVVSATGEALGEVSDYSEDGGGLLVVRLVRGRRLLDVPFAEPYVAAVDMPGRRIVFTEAWRGLLDPVEAR